MASNERLTQYDSLEARGRLHANFHGGERLTDLGAEELRCTSNSTVCARRF